MVHLLNLLAAVALLVWGTQFVRTGILRVFGENLRHILAVGMATRVQALFAGLGVTGGDTTGAALITIGVLLGSSAWWVVLTSIVSVVRTRITTAWIRRINVASGLLIGAFAVISIASVVL